MIAPDANAKPSRPAGKLWVAIVPVVLISGAVGATASYVFLGRPAAQTSSAAPTNPVPDVPRDIQAITKSLYRVQYGMHISILLVTADGVLVTDPTNPDAARWLQEEIKKRFNKPIRYLVYSHGHSDHVGGAAVLATPGVTILASEKAKQLLINAPHPGANIPIPTRTFTGETVLDFGGEHIKLLEIAPETHAPGLIAMDFVDEKVVWAPDLISNNAVGFMDFSNESFLNMIAAIEKIQKLDYNVLVDSHGPMGSKADAQRFLDYLIGLRNQAMAGVKAGKSLDEIKKSINLDKYKGLAFFETWAGLNVEGAVKAIKVKQGIPVPEAPVTPERLRGLTAFCGACHGPNGVSASDAYPNLAGQKYAYLLKALNAYQQQRRYDPYMSEVEFLTAAEREALATHYSALPAGH